MHFKAFAINVNHPSSGKGTQYPPRGAVLEGSSTLRHRLLSSWEATSITTLILEAATSKNSCLPKSVPLVTHGCPHAHTMGHSCSSASCNSICSTHRHVQGLVRSADSGKHQHRSLCIRGTCGATCSCNISPSGLTHTASRLLKPSPDSA